MNGCVAPRNRRGTTLIELLVVIVVFLVGILAVVQIFPKGFQLLLTSRNNIQATALGRDLIERLKSSPDQIPDEIMAVHYVNGLPIEDPTRNIFDLGPQGDSVDSLGNLYLAGTEIGNWQLYSGANSFRRIIGEGQRVPAPRLVGSMYGGLRLLAFGPVDPNEPLDVYANDMDKVSGYPTNGVAGAPTPDGGESVFIGQGATSYAATLYNTPVGTGPFQFFVDLNPADNPTQIIYFPTNGQFNRLYHLSLSAYVGTTSNFTRFDYPDLSVTIPFTHPDANNIVPPLIGIPIATILADTPGAIPSGDTVGSVEYDSIRIQPQYHPPLSPPAFSADPFEFQVLDPNLGVLLFNPAAYSTSIERTGGAREPLIAKVDYDVKDWRILRQDFRLDSQVNLNGGIYAQFQLGLPGVLVGTQTGPDGLANGGLPVLEAPTSPYNTWQNPLADNVMVVDVQTGGVVCELDPNNTTNQLITTDKTHGMITVNGAAGNAGALTGYVLLPGTTTPVSMDLTSRPLRVLFRARNNWAMFPTKSAATYSIVYTSPPGEGQVYVPPTLGTRIYFPASDLHQKVTVDELFYTAGAQAKQLDGQDFQIEFPTVPDGVGLPCIDVTSVDSTATALNNNYGVVARGIKGASLTVQVLWNPSSFHLTTNGVTNIGLLDTWGQSWRRATNQTYLSTQEIQ